jgi:predicted transcriptional regulator YdeE
LGCLEWLYAFPAGVTDTGGYGVLDFPGGLYAVATCRDDGEEITSTNRRIHEWVAQSGCCEECSRNADGAARYDMGHVITPPSAKERLGYSQMDLFVPIRYKDRNRG